MYTHLYYVTRIIKTFETFKIVFLDLSMAQRIETVLLPIFWAEVVNYLLVLLWLNGNSLLKSKFKVIFFLKDIRASSEYS